MQRIIIRQRYKLELNHLSLSLLSQFIFLTHLEITNCEIVEKIEDSKSDFYLNFNFPLLISLKINRCKGHRSFAHIIFNGSFPSLTDLEFNNDKISEFKQFPSTLKRLNCSYNEQDDKALINVPESLTFLKCVCNYLSYISNFPSGLVELDCSNNYLDFLPLLPHTLTFLNCSKNLLRNLNELPRNLLFLDMDYNRLEELPELPPRLVKLFCQENRLHALPSLPDSLQVIWCNNNYLQTLNQLPANLQVLQCSFNKIDRLPPLPPCLTYLNTVSTLLFPKDLQQSFSNSSEIQSIFEMHQS